LNDFYIPIYFDHETPQICEEEPIIPFFLVLLLSQYQFGCLLRNCVEVGKFGNQITNLSFPPSSTFHDLDMIKKIGMVHGSGGEDSSLDFSR